MGVGAGSFQWVRNRVVLRLVRQPEKKDMNCGPPFRQKKTYNSCMELFTISCETCHARLNVHHEDAMGQIHPCPRCGSMVLVQRSVVEEQDSKKESTVLDGVEPSASDEHRDSTGIPASTILSKGAILIRCNMTERCQKIFLLRRPIGRMLHRFVSH